MGRKREEGPKNLATVVDNPRYMRVFFTKGSQQMPIMVSTASYDRIVAGFERRGYTVEKAAQ